MNDIHKTTLRADRGRIVIRKKPKEEEHIIQKQKEEEHIIQIPQTTLVDFSKHFPYGLIFVILGLLFVGLVVYIIYDIVTHFGVNSGLVITNVTLLSKRINPSHLNVVNEQITNRMLLRVINCSEILTQYNKKTTKHGDSNGVTFFYNVYQVGQSEPVKENIQCKPLWSSLEYSCCCFVHSMDRMMCQDDDVFHIKTVSENETFVKSFQVTCDLVYGIKTKTQRELPRIYLGLSSDYIDNITPISDYDINDECIIKLNYMCLQ